MANIVTVVGLLKPPFPDDKDSVPVPNPLDAIDLITVPTDSDFNTQNVCK